MRMKIRVRKQMKPYTATGITIDPTINKMVEAMLVDVAEDTTIITLAKITHITKTNVTTTLLIDEVQAQELQLRLIEINN